ncbi:MAG: hypothetical protein C5B51_02435 [Terriglobia bacterium]|nr:MAG: hypothetical protein C5B51_02435 [Terriglobia bacterium]
MTTWRLTPALLVLIAAAFGQSSATLTGRVQTGSEGSPIPKASIHATNTSSGAMFSAQSAADGKYEFRSLPAGPYQITAEFPPLFLPFKRENVQLEAGQTFRLDIPLNDEQLNTLGDGGSYFVYLSSEHPAPKGRTPRTREGRPDLNGVWLPALLQTMGSKPEPLPWAAELAKKRSDGFGKDPQTYCLPGGLTYSGMFFEYRLVQTPTMLVIIDADSGNPTRQIYLDGRDHPRDPNPSFMGHSVGHWEGDALVVDTVGFNDRVWLTNDNYPQTEKMHVTERFRRPDLGHLEMEITFDDPGAFQKPWKMKRVSSLAPRYTEVLEYVCTENNRDIEHLVVK